MSNLKLRKMAAKRKTLVLDHDDLIASLIEVRKRTDRAKVVAAFVASLRTSRLDLRSPLGSYAYHLKHPLHKLNGFDPSAGSANYLQCKVCSYFSNKGRRDFVIDFDHWASVRKTSTVENFHIPAYAFADLTLFADAEVPPLVDADWEVMRQLLERIRNLPSTAQLGVLNKALTGLFKADKYVRQQVLEILGFCGVLQPKSIPLVTGRFFCNDKNQLVHSRDWAYPVAAWTGVDGVNDVAVAFWFPELVRH